MKSEISVLSMGDIHFGCSRNNTESIIRNMYDMITSHANIDLLLLGGDIFDKQLPFGSDDSNMVTSFMLWLSKFCVKHNIIIRSVEGTPSHDVRQTVGIANIINKSDIPVDFKHYTDITVEYIESLDVRLLFVPDEIRPTITETMKDIHDIIPDEGIDIAIVHGHMNYQLPITLESSYPDDSFDFVRYCVLISHVHNHTSKGKIIAPGSFDRLVFGEEEAKGAIYLKINPNTGLYWTFLENKGAKLFDTIEINDNDISKAKGRLLKKLSKYSSDYLRIVYRDKTLDVKLLASICRENNIILSTKYISDEIEEGEDDIPSDIIEEFSITKDNIYQLLSSEVDVDVVIFDEELSNVI